jgi:hypothetical protein
MACSKLGLNSNNFGDTKLMRNYIWEEENKNLSIPMLYRIKKYRISRGPSQNNRNLVAPGIELGTSGFAARNSDHKTTEAAVAQERNSSFCLIGTKPTSTANM